MRFVTDLFVLLAILPGIGFAATPQSSFGPEISAEDFSLHLDRLAGYQSTDRTDAAATYIQSQFARLGLTESPALCNSDRQGLQAVLHGTAQDGRAVVYLADPDKPGEIAALLEIAERFMTQRPRPSHDVLFLISSVGVDALSTCDAFRQVPRIIQPAEMETRDASSLVRDLIELQGQGK